MTGEKQNVYDRLEEAFKEMGFELKEIQDGAQRLTRWKHPNGYGFRLVPSGNQSVYVTLFQHGNPDWDIEFKTGQGREKAVVEAISNIVKSPRLPDKDRVKTILEGVNKGLGSSKEYMDKIRQKTREGT